MGGNNEDEESDSRSATPAQEKEVDEPEELKGENPFEFLSAEMQECIIDKIGQEAFDSLGATASLGANLAAAQCAQQQ